MANLGDDVFKISEHAARARLSRIIRNSEAGWLFYSPGGSAYHLLSDEAELLTRRGLRRLEKCSWLASELSKLPVKAFKLAFVILGIGIALSVAVGRVWIEPYGDFIARYIFSSLILFSLFFALLRPLIALALRSTIMLAWQAREASDLRKQGRGGVAGATEQKHNRYNLFRILFCMALTVLAVRFVTMWFHTPPQLMERGFVPEIICLAIMAISGVPARLIDITHIRRKWFD